MALEVLTVEHVELAQRKVGMIQKAREFKLTHRRDFTPQWYDWQSEFFDATLHRREVMLLAANRVGKTFPGTYAFAVHVTGDYPKGWDGGRIEHAVTAWALGVDATQTRDVLQKELLGVEGEDGVWRGGWIHHDEIVSVERSNLPGAISKAYIKHKSGGTSTLDFKAYRQAKTGQQTLVFAGSSVDIILVDEQPPDEVMGQLRTRLLTGRRNLGGYLLLTLTPELGETELIKQFMSPTDDERQWRHLVGPIAWERAAHLSPEICEQMLSAYPRHERDMRSKGLPLFGSGKIFIFDESACVIPAFDLMTRPWLKVLRAIDIGIDHPTGMVWLAYDAESRTYYVVRAFKQSDANAATHTATLNSLWKSAPCVVPPDIDGREKGSGETVAKSYRDAGLTGLVNFQNPDESNYVEPGLFAMQQAMSEGRFFVFAGTGQPLVDELRSYHRDEKGKIVKTRDDVIDACRYGFQMVALHGVQLGTLNRKIEGLYPQLGLQRHTKQEGRTWQRR